MFTTNNKRIRTEAAAKQLRQQILKSVEYYDNFQSTGVLPNVFSASLAAEKHLQLKNLVWESGDGCAVLMTLCLVVSIILPFF